VKRSGFADTPLHGGLVPSWLAERMTRLGTAIAESILLHYGQSAFLSRLSDPFWFQALGSVMGMDWHSSAITTSVMGALKRGLNPRASDLGLYVCGTTASRSPPRDSSAFQAKKSMWAGTTPLRALVIAGLITKTPIGGARLRSNPSLHQRGHHFNRNVRGVYIRCRLTLNANWKYSAANAQILLAEISCVERVYRAAILVLPLGAGSAFTGFHTQRFRERPTLTVYHFAPVKRCLNRICGLRSGAQPAPAVPRGERYWPEVLRCLREQSCPQGRRGAETASRHSSVVFMRFVI
jgi:hypothetical protein